MLQIKFYAEVYVSVSFSMMSPPVSCSLQPRLFAICNITKLNFRYCMAVVQVVMFFAMLVQGILILSKYERSEGQYKTPDNLLEITLVLSFFVVGGALFASIVIIYLICWILCFENMLELYVKLCIMINLENDFQKSW